MLQYEYLPVVFCGQPHQTLLSCSASSAAAILMLHCLFLCIEPLLPVTAQNMKMPMRHSRVGRLKVLVTTFPSPLLHGLSGLSAEEGAVGMQHLCTLTQEEAAFSRTALPLNKRDPVSGPINSPAYQAGLHWNRFSVIDTPGIVTMLPKLGCGF